MQTKKIYDMLFTFHNTTHITLGNEQCLKLLLGVFNIKKRGDLFLFLEGAVQIEKNIIHSTPQLYSHDNLRNIQ